VTVGACVGLFFGTLAWVDSGMLVSGAIVLVVLGVGMGVWTARAMTRYWPGSKELSGKQRVAVVDAARRGNAIGDPGLASAVVDYGRGLHAAAEKGRPWRWVLLLLLLVAAGSAVWDSFFGSWGNVVVSAVYLVLAGLELLWWPKWLIRLLANADRAADLARHVGAS
jgi:hypothetical protein